jgi:prophage maintenance system killer protein
MSEIIIYTSKDGRVQLDINFEHDTLWLNQQQMADLFGTKRQAITKHLKNIFISGELNEDSVCSKIEHTAQDGKKYKTNFYTLDAVISVGYRINSKQATNFRVWATEVLKEHLICGYSLNKKRLGERGFDELQQAVELLHKTLLAYDHVSDIGSETIQLIISYAKTWHLLLAYDEDKLKIPTTGQQETIQLDYNVAINAISSLKYDLAMRNEASQLFGNERQKGLESILNNIEQTFDNTPLYPTAIERAAHLLYFVIKDHPFTDGNKRIACLIFLLYLKLQNITIKFNENGLVALALLIAESDPSQKDILIKLTVNLLID